MPDTTTANYALTKPEVGGSDDTWGGKINDNLDALDGIAADFETRMAALEAIGGTAELVLAALLTVDGDGSGLNADLLDGEHGAFYLPAADYTAEDVLAKLLTVDGSGSGLDADMLDGHHAAEFLLAGDLPGEVVIDASLTAFGGLAFAADKLPYSTGDDVFALTPFTAFGRSLVGLDDVDALADLSGALTESGASLATPGYIEFSNGLKLQWGSGTLTGNALGVINFPVAFTTFARCLVTGGSSNTGREGDVHPYQAPSLTQQAIANSADATNYYAWFAVGV